MQRNPISSFAGWDLIVSALALFVFVAVEGSRLKVKPLWAPFVATLVDVTGLVIYFTIAYWILRGTLL